MPFTSKRYKKGWLTAGINQKEYVKTAIKLAIRKNQIKNLKSKGNNVYVKEVETLRTKIYTILFYNQQKPQ